MREVYRDNWRFVEIGRNARISVSYCSITCWAGICVFKAPTVIDKPATVWGKTRTVVDKPATVRHKTPT
ncbi:hypothetical protein KAH81_08905, partial [bacterium]|nr:hypothetical protein [bacterium]